MFTTVLIDFDNVIDDVMFITWYGGLFDQSLCDVKHDFKPFIVAKRHCIFGGLSVHNHLSLYRKHVSVGISSTSNFILTSLIVTSPCFAFLLFSPITLKCL